MILETTDADGTLEAGGTDIAVTAGDYKVTLDIANGTYSLEALCLGSCRRCL